jgi:hypothetical protein
MKVNQAFRKSFVIKIFDLRTTTLDLEKPVIDENNHAISSYYQDILFF